MFTAGAHSLVLPQPRPRLSGLETKDLICGLQQSGEKTLLQTDSASLSSRWAVESGCTSLGDGE